MRTVVLTEYVPSAPIPLSVTQRDALRQLVTGLTITPASGSTDTYMLTSGSTVGVARVGELTVELRPEDRRRAGTVPRFLRPRPEVLEARTVRSSRATPISPKPSSRCSPGPPSRRSARDCSTATVGARTR